MAQLTMQVEDWLAYYKPLVNHIDDNASWQDEDGRGIMFETYGAELEFVLGCNPACVWTYCDNEDGKRVLVSGMHAFEMGVIGYFVTQVPVADDDAYSIVLD
jgi:hypothetical protein